MVSTTGKLKFFVWLLNLSICLVRFRASGGGGKRLLLLRRRMSFNRSFSLPWGRYWASKSCLNTSRHHISSSIQKCSEKTLVPAAIVNSFQRRRSNGFLGKHCQKKAISLISVAFMQLVPGADRVVRRICILCINF